MKDRYGRDISYLRLALTGACNLRCDYCRPDGIPDLSAGKSPLTYNDFIRIIEASAKLGITKIRLTGGEPLLYPRLIPLIKEAKVVPGIKEVHITTNGTLLASAASDLVEAGIDGINISLDSLDYEKYKKITRGGSLSSVLEGIEALQRLYFRNIKINSVLMLGVNDDEVDSLINWAAQKELTLRFIEMMPIGEARDLMEERSFEFQTGKVLANHQLFQGRKPVSEGTALYYTLPGSPARIGFITPLHGEFCQRCNKIRINAEGELRQCLMSRDILPLKDVLNDKVLLQDFLREAIEDKPHSGEETGFQESCMVAIGG